MEAPRILLPGRVAYLPRFLDEDTAQAALSDLIARTPWKQDHARFGAKEIPLPRLVAWYGDEGTEYRYSGILNVPLPFSELLTRLRRRIEGDGRLADLAGTGEPPQFNSVLLNYYRTGADSVGFHSDDER